MPRAPCTIRFHSFREDVRRLSCMPWSSALHLRVRRSAGRKLSPGNRRPVSALRGRRAPTDCRPRSGSLRLCRLPASSTFEPQNCCLSALAYIGRTSLGGHLTAYRLTSRSDSHLYCPPKQRGSSIGPKCHTPIDGTEKSELA